MKAESSSEEEKDLQKELKVSSNKEKNIKNDDEELEEMENIKLYSHSIN